MFQGLGEVVETRPEPEAELETDNAKIGILSPMQTLNLGGTWSLE